MATLSKSHELTEHVPKMATLSEFHELAEHVRNWGRWGDRDELGTLNFISDETVVRAANLVRRGAVFPLGLEFGSSGPQGFLPHRNNPLHVMTVDGGDESTFIEHGPGWSENLIAKQIGETFAASPFRYNDDVIVMPLQAATQWDALSHAYYDERLYNGFPADSVTSAGARYCSIDKVDVKGVTSRGVLLDVAKYRGVDFLEPGQDITPDELDAVAKTQGVEVGTGDIVLVRTGWIPKWRETGNGMEASSGLSWDTARWLHENEIAAVAADNVMVESFTSEVEGMFMPLHLLTLRDMGMMLGEFWNLEALALDCASDGVYEFQIIAPPLRITGAVGSPLNPIAIK